MPIAVWLIMMFVLGAAVGSFLNVCIYRLPLEKSLLWPSSRCGQCLQPIRWYDNIPLVSWWLLRGRCRTCAAPYSIRYFAVELLSALAFAGLFYLEVVENVHQYDFAVLGPLSLTQPGLLRFGPGRGDVAVLVTFAWHAVLFSFLLVATFCDLDHHIIPLPLTVTGTVVGLVGAVLFPWPWPYTPDEALPKVSWMLARPPDQGGFREGLYFWPFWGESGANAMQPGRLPGGFHPGGNWQTGLVTGLAGLLLGTFMVRWIRLCFGLGMGAAYMDDADPDIQEGWWTWLNRIGGKTLGLGDADLMMMAGSFIGWQPMVVGFFLAVIPGLFLGVASLVRRGDNLLPFGPALAIGILFTVLVWPIISPNFQAVFFSPMLLWIAFAASTTAMVIAGFVLRLLRALRT